MFHGKQKTNIYIYIYIYRKQLLINLLKLIIENGDLTMNTMNHDTNNVQNDINDLKASLEYTETVPQENVAKAEKKGEIEIIK